MSTQHHTESSVIRFFDNFLQEKNIKWVLATGMLILLGSSLMVVMPHWDVFAPVWKFVTIVAYTGVIYLVGSWSDHHLALRKTGTSLLALTVLMVPVSFMAWHWLWASENTAIGQATALLLLGINTVVATFISRKTFLHFLRGSQPTFVASYLVLSFAGAVAPTIREAGALYSWLASLVVWAVFAIGVVKVNRYVFWLTEEHLAPRILGFFPILLLGGQFLLIFSVNFARSYSVDWIGFGCALVAIPVLLTADAVARVFQARTGNLVRPIPWPIMLPFTVGLALCITAVGLAGSSIFQRPPYALVPTGALTALLMAVTAKRTNRTAFVWAMLLAITLAYNFSPVFFQTLAWTVVAHGAAAVKEARLPYAFYGLTYLPLIVTAAGVSVFAQRRGHLLFACPLRQFSVSISLMLLACAFGHLKALLPVSAAMIGVFASQAVVFKDRRLMLAAVVAFFIAAAGATPFTEAMFDTGPLVAMRYLIPLGCNAILLMASPLLDGRIRRIPLPESYQRADVHSLWDSLCRTVSLVGTCGIAFAWLLRPGGPVPAVHSICGLVIGGLLFAHSLVWVRSSVSWFTYAFIATELIRWAGEVGLTVDWFATVVVLLLLLQWLLKYLLAHRPNHRISRAWANVNHDSAWIGLCGLTVVVALPDMVYQTLGNHASWLAVTRNFLLIAWCWDAVRVLHSATASAENTSRFRNVVWRRGLQSAVTMLGSIGIYGAVSSVLVVSQGVEAIRWTPVAWTLTAMGTLPFVESLRRRLVQMDQQVVLSDHYHALRLTAIPMEATMYAALGSFAALQLVVYSTPLRIAGYIALAGLLINSTLRHRPAARLATFAVVNWTVLLACVQWFVPHATNVLDFFWLELRYAPWCVAAMATASLFAWTRFSRHTPNAIDEIARIQQVGLRIATYGSLAITLRATAIEPWCAALAVCSFAMLILSELWNACRKSDESLVWIAEAIGALAVGYFLWFRVITFGRGLSMFATLGVGGLLYIAGLLAQRRKTTEILARPFLSTGLWMPMVAVGIGIVRHLIHGDQVVWHGMNSLAILLAGAFYFWQALERRNKGFALLSAAVLNVALALLWLELQLHDPQFYMIPIGISILALVEILRREIPTVWHDPIRYAGALTILVSPTFHIVSGSWLHLFTLMLASTAVLLVSIGLRIRALMYAGAAFLIADLIGMVVCGSVDHPNLLWIAGIGFGAAILTLGAFCEHNRERLLQRMRAVSSQLEQWN